MKSRMEVLNKKVQEKQKRRKKQEDIEDKEK